MKGLIMSEPVRNRMDFAIRDRQVIFNGRKQPLLSGAIHYFRTLPEQWRDRLLKLKNGGFNAVETYLAWHLHEEREGVFDFSGRLDFIRFIRTAEELGLAVIVRPGPYICSECDLGGMPGWLLGKPGLRLRCSNPAFMHYAEEFLSRALKLLAPLQCTRGGNIIAVQVENEYGSYAADKEYLRRLVSFIRDCGIDIQLFTSDGASEYTLKNGTLPELPATVNYRNRPREACSRLDACDTGYPNAHLTMELWIGKAWHWGVKPEHHADRDVAQDIREILSDGASVNCYMFHGGTNFGFTSGANYFPQGYLPLLTSYEVDGFLDEGGNPTGKYYAVQKVMEEFRPGTTAPPPESVSTVYPAVELAGFVSLSDSLDALSRPVSLPLPETMEYFGQSFGFIHYSTRVDPVISGKYLLRNMRDRALIRLNGRTIAVVSRQDKDQTFSLEVTENNSLLEILVENMGRVNFNTEMELERKGFTAVVQQDNHVGQLTGWQIRPLPLKDLSRLKFGEIPEENHEPGFYRGEFEAEKIADTYLLFPDGIRGYVWINGFNLGRYWTIGPQRTLYLPYPLLKKGKNEVIVFELHGLNSLQLRFSPRRIMDEMSEMVLS